jgi:radical SAM superfamily enzyme YgiQ (UPF0313 family)
MSRANLVDLDLLKKMKKAGCVQINYGIETGDPAIMKKIKKGITLEQARKAIKETKEVGIRAKTFFMIGHPWDTKETVERTIKFAKEIDPSNVQFNIVTPYPGSELWDIAKEMGVIKSDDLDWDRLVIVGDNIDPIMRTYTLSPADIRRYRDKAVHDWGMNKSFKLLKNPIEVIRLIRRKGILPLFKIYKNQVLQSS